MVGWALTSAGHTRANHRGSGNDDAWKGQRSRARALGRLTFPNRPAGGGGRGVTLASSPFRRGDLMRIDGEWYHLPTLLRLHRAGRLSWGSPGWRALEQAGHLRRGQMN